MTRRKFSGIMLLVLLSSTLILIFNIQRVQGEGPVPVITGPTPSNQATIDVSIDFDDSNRAIIASEIGNPAKVEITGGTVSNKVPQNSPQDTIWLVTIDRAGGNSDVNVTVHPRWYQDEAENWNLGASKIFTYDDSSPVPVITSTEPDPTNSPFEISIDFNATVDTSVFPLLNYSNCDWSNPQSVSGDDSVWTLQIDPIVDGEVTVQVPAGIYQDAALNWNLESNLFSRIYIEPSVIHDVAVVNMTSLKTVVGVSYYLTINVTVENQGDVIETFNVTIYANATAIDTKEVLLAQSGYMTLTYLWNTTGFVKGNYTISAYAIPVPGETNTVDNTYVNGWVLVTIPGDVDGDRKVDMRDIGAQGRAFGATPIDPRWNSNADINGDGKVDMRDIGIAARNFGQNW